jgi:hypothetical protein
VKQRDSELPKRAPWHRRLLDCEALAKEARLSGGKTRPTGHRALRNGVAVLTLLWATFAVTCLPRWAAAAGDLASLLPKSNAVAGWRMQGTPGTYTRANLYDYIDGGADIYLGYGFTRAVVVDYLGPDGSRITVELYDMGSSYDAFGVFARERAPEQPPVGQGSSYAGGLLTFWKDGIFARVFADRETESTRPAVLRLGKLVATTAAKNGPMPPLVALLPRAGMGARSVRYLHTDTALNSVLYLPGNPLRLGMKTNAAYAEYPTTGGAPAKVVIVEYGSARDAAAAFSALAKLHAATVSKGRTDYTVTTDRFKRAGGAVRGRYVVVVSNAADEVTARRLLTAASTRVKKG